MNPTNGSIWKKIIGGVAAAADFSDTQLSPGREPDAGCARNRAFFAGDSPPLRRALLETQIGISYEPKNCSLEKLSIHINFQTRGVS